MRLKAGVALIELVLSITIMSIALVGVFQASIWLAARAADPFVLQQAALIADSYLQEIASQAFLDPSSGNFCPSPAHTNRSVFDNICDYDGLSDTPPEDPQGNSLSNLAAYSVSVNVDTSTSVTLGPAGHTITNASAGLPQVAKIDVHVTHNPTSQVVTMSLYRTNLTS